jgi:mRNA interferase MazF
MIVKRGDLYWAELEPRSGSEQKGRRPVVIISNDGFNEVPSWRSIIVIPVTTSSRQALRGPTVVALSGVGSVLSRNSIAICHQITTLDRSKLDTRIGALSQAEIEGIEQGILAACDLEP